MRRHEECAQRHEAAAALWDTGHEAERAEFERRCARIEREAAQLDAERAELERVRARAPGRPDAAACAVIDRLAEEIERRNARLRAGDAALEQERVRLWPHHAAREHGRGAIAANAPSRREPVAVEPQRDPFGASSHAQAQTRENARRLSSVLSRTANVLETSASLAQANAERLEGLGRSDAGAEERRVADAAYDAARRARVHATRWLEFAEGQAQ